MKSKKDAEEKKKLETKFEEFLLSFSQERRMQQQREALMKEKETAEKVAARAFAHSYLSDLVPAVLTNLSNKGFFYDPIQRSAYILQ